MHGETGETQVTKNFHNESSEKAQKDTFHEHSCSKWIIKHRWQGQKEI